MTDIIQVTLGIPHIFNKLILLDKLKKGFRIEKTKSAEWRKNQLR